MRKLLLILGMTICFIQGQSQITYHNYLDCSSVWRYYVGGSTFGGSFKGYFTLYFDGDTLINGDYYYRQKALFRYQGSSVTQQYKTNFIREDSNLNFIGSCNYGQLWSSSSIIEDRCKTSHASHFIIFIDLLVYFLCFHFILRSIFCSFSCFY